ncbi:Mif2/CENP-C like-domain-containing protein [Mycena rosella]|uniref:CENP-C homolog n=1 Tax=Mycena rosella TaxID=1033263 RepID=A0AAD7GWJ6_MYCRO|nr:Mif2/CENP-C like-domain-containing protein [Mycena rosella]
MPPSARKSSVGAARRAVQKSHVPYRGDDPTVGKRTGISVQPVARGSDGFEPFDQLIGQLSEHEPLKKKKKRKKSISQEEDEEEDDEDGEMSMDVDSPIQNYSNTRPPTTPRTPRPIARTSEVDFDQVPSPRPHGSGGRTAGPSRLTKSAQELLDQDEDDEDYSGDGGGFDDYAQPDGDSPPREVSFTEMDTREEDDEEEQDEEEEQPVASPTRGKGKAVEEVEDEIALGMDDVDMAPPESDEEEEAPASPPKKAPPKPKPAPKPRVQKENRERARERDVPDGVRRSRRVPYAPLDWWRLERVEYGGRDPDGEPILCPTIKAIIRIPKEPVIPLGKQGRAARARAHKGAPTPKVVEKVVEVPVEVLSANPEEGWDDGTETDGVVKSYPDGEDVMRRIAFTAKMFQPTAAANNEWFFQKVFNDPDFVAAGQLLIPPKGRKPSKQTKDNTFIFFVIEGAVNLKVCETSLIVASGGMFMVPRGNTYFIENIADRDAKLFFTQARKLRENEPDEAPRGSSSGVIQQPARAVSVVTGSEAVREKQLRRGMSSNV